MDAETQDRILQETLPMTDSILALSKLRDEFKDNREMARNLSLAITHLEDAQDKVYRAAGKSLPE